MSTCLTESPCLTIALCHPGSLRRRGQRLVQSTTDGDRRTLPVAAVVTVVPVRFSTGSPCVATDSRAQPGGYPSPIADPGYTNRSTAMIVSRIVRNTEIIVR